MNRPTTYRTPGRPLIASLAAAAALVIATVATADDAHPSWRVVSENDLFEVTLKPEKPEIEIGAFARWHLIVNDAEGAPVYPARFALGGGMPGHGHGLPTQPAVTAHLGGSTYLIEGLKLNMAGDWLLLVGIETPESRDTARIEFTVDY